ncbi:thioesterase family protein [Sulfitobacter donghicola]|uniref:Thioesterase n=1 Tax=Sulfitobacter donghicola DSW-25 = KCTC 12864 = JCM 14565 TaxID=1300350 RepID=A0A073IIM8_9RHOB|nr:thioesterase family protein [Sulfitobacter donghicola]KEJ89376.1 thioesterase [Sulfitobacter donghicola DSW-25 = KCTC 12864 = JCM 14565]KIN69191.1 Thioesterase superfamily protein [Sulfitobacter donghicola DSW-25 = KCTC 12864 = JCM 14565]
MTDVFRTSPLTVLPEWIDYNGHLNMAYYSVLMDKSADQTYPLIGFGPDYRERTGCTTYVAEFHICYVRELHEGDKVTSTVRLIDFDEKRFHIFQELWHEDGWLAATGEALTLHVDQSGDRPRVAPMPDDILANLAKMKDAQKSSPLPDRVGRKIAIAQK